MEQSNAPQKLSLDEFCRRLSQSDRRVELIAGFHASETAKGNTQDTEPEFRSRFSKFASQPA